MPWPAWSSDEPAALARYVMDELAEKVHLDIVREDAIRRGARRDVARAIYDALRKRDIHYSRERWSPGDGSQIIRDPDDMLEGGNATCLDLALLFAGICLGHELLPLVVVVDGHALVAVSLLDDPREPHRRARVRRDGAWIDDGGVLHDTEVFASLIAEDGGHYLPIECTGFAKTELSTGDVPQDAGRQDGKLDFESAIAAARTECAKRRFMFAVDPALRQRTKGVARYDRDPSPKRIAQEVKSIFPEIEVERQEAQDREFEKAYLAQVAIRYGRVETPGVPDLKEFRQPLTLSYVSLFIKPSQTEREAGRRHAEYELEAETEGKAGRKHAEYVLESQPLLTVRASAGAGKTTLLNWIALACAQGANKDSNDRWHGGVPFFIPLRALKEQGAPDLGRFVDYTVDLKQWPRDVPSGWIVKVLQSKRGVIMLDGVDELSSKGRPDFWRWLKDELMSRYPGNRIIITSRYLPETSSHTNWQPPPGFVSADLDEMTDEDVGQFVRRWHDGALETEPDPVVRADLVKAREGLPGKLADPVNHRVRELCGTPLLCSLICALHWREEGYLPGRRIELYERCVGMLVEERDRKRGIEKPEGPLRWLTKDDKEMLLQRIAYQMMKNVMVGEETQARIEISKDRAIGWIAGCVSSFQDEKARNADPAEVLVHLVERTTLLRSPVSDTIEFSHRSFQEYLAACAAGAADDDGDLAKRADDDQWHEIIILASGTKSGGIPFGNKLIRALLKAGESWKLRLSGSHHDLRHTYFALAVACLETAKRPDPDLATRVLSHLNDIVPPRNAAAAKNLSAAGEVALPYLGYDMWKDESDEIVASCARTVRLINGGPAINMLVTGYGSDERESVLAEVARGQGISVFDIPTVRKKLIEGAGIPYGLRGFVNDLRGLADWHGGLPVAGGLESKPILKKLSLAYCEFTDLTPLAALQSLESLNLAQCRGIRDLGPLATLTEMRELDLAGCKGITDLTPLAALQGLEVLDLSHCEGIRDLGPLAALSRLRYLELSGLQDIADYTPLGSLQRLERLNLSGVQIPGNSELPPLGSLETLYLFGSTKITDLGPLVVHQPRLRVLSLSGCTGITDLTPLTALHAGLVSLDLTECTGITDLTPLAALETSLQTLDLTGCTGVHNLRPLQALKRLQSLTLSRTRPSSPYRHSRQPGRFDAALGFADYALTAVGGVSLAQAIAQLARTIAKSTVIGAADPSDDQPSMSLIDLGPIAHLSGLEVLRLQGWDGAKALPSLEALQGLKYLNIFGWRDLSDLTPLTPLANLRSLNLAGCHGITDLGPLRALTSLRTLSLVGVNRIVDFNPLMGLELDKIVVGRKLFDRLPSSLRSKAEIPEVSGHSTSFTVSEDEMMLWEARYVA